jgi:Type II CAAX prenyl endopeptidase Rce1-like
MEAFGLIAHTLIPEADSYGIVILVVYSVSSSSLAVHIINSRWLAGKRNSFWTVRNWVMAFTVAWGFVLFPAGQIFGNSPSAWVLSIPFGIVAGWVAGWADRAIIRRTSRWQQISANRSGPKGSSTTRLTHNAVPRNLRPSLIPTAGQAARRRDIGLHEGRQSFRLSATELQFGFWSIAIASVLEELIYRGFLVQVCFLLPNRFLIAVALAGTLIVFALSHIQFGWSHVLAKFPLGALALISVLYFGTVLPAVAAHVVFNIGVWKGRNSS